MIVVRRRFTPLVGLITLAAVACKASREQAHTAGADSARAAASAMPGMGAHTGSAAMIDEMRRHLDSMRTVPVDTLTAMLPAHRQMVANMIATFNTEMRDMNMPGDAAWQSQVDSLRADLVHMPAMSPAEFRGFLPDHERRVTRLMQTHQAMMASMKM